MPGNVGEFFWVPRRVLLFRRCGGIGARNGAHADHLKRRLCLLCFLLLFRAPSPTLALVWVLILSPAKTIFQARNRLRCAPAQIPRQIRSLERLNHACYEIGVETIQGPSDSPAATEAVWKKEVESVLNGSATVT